MTKWLLRVLPVVFLMGVACDDKKSSSPISPAAKPAENPTGGSGGPPTPPPPPPIPASK